MAMAYERQNAALAPTIIVVEHDASVRRSLQFALTAEGFAVRTYSRGNDMLDASTPPDHGCVVVDYDLPDMTGLELLALLRTRRVILPAILITTNPSATLRRRAEEAGVPMLEKPLLGDNLIAGIAAALTRSAGPALP